MQGLAAVMSFRTIAWFGRGFRSPLRDFLLADEVGTTHFGRAYGLERSADMIGAVVGPLVAAALVWSGLDFKSVILWSLIPSVISVVSIAAMTRDRHVPRDIIPVVTQRLLGAIALSGVYIAIEETLEKAVVAQLLPRNRRSIGLGVLASANALGDLGSSVFVGAMLATGYSTAAFAVPAMVGALGVAWMWALSHRGVVS